MRLPVTLLTTFLAAGGLAMAAAPPAPRVQEVWADLDRDGRDERILLDPAREKTVEVWRGKTLAWEGVPARWKPWKLTTADVNGDGTWEVVVGLHKATRFFPQPHNCLFVYAFDGKGLVPMWLGSRLSKPFTDFTFANLDRDRAEELIALETTREGRRCVTVYSWSGFGFAGDWQRGAWKSARLLEASGGRILVEAENQRVAIRR